CQQAQDREDTHGWKLSTVFWESYLGDTGERERTPKSKGVESERAHWGDDATDLPLLAKLFAVSAAFLANFRHM
ncbi:MAG TPA: hypothetical protein DCQ96_00375, partial [Verrucomicrobiales bacterium]|nr:hypothetical protein [Verrucomicrobiales bacterium]